MASKFASQAKKKAMAPSKTRKTPRKRASSTLLLETTLSTRPKLKINPPKSQFMTFFILPIDEKASSVSSYHSTSEVTRAAM